MKEHFDVTTQVLTIRVGSIKFQSFNNVRSKLAGKTWRWRARGSNGRIVATSGESFAKRGNAERAMRGFIKAIGFNKDHV